LNHEHPKGSERIPPKAAEVLQEEEKNPADQASVNPLQKGLEAQSINNLLIWIISK